MTNPFRTDLIDIFIRRGHKGKEIVEMVREIEVLLDGQRCEWTVESRSTGTIVYKTSCGKQAVTWDQKDFNEAPFCQSCGNRVEVKHD